MHMKATATKKKVSYAKWGYLFILPFFLVFLGTVTGVGGGLIRDMMAGVPPYIFVRHIYACASIVGAIACVWVYRLWGGVPAMVIGTVVVILIRYLAAHYRWNLPRLRRE